MGAPRGLVNFIAGGLAGAAVGAAVAALLSPRSGPDNRRLICQRIEEAKIARAAAEAATEAALREQFRRAVDDPNALRAE